MADFPRGFCLPPTHFRSLHTSLLSYVISLPYFMLIPPTTPLMMDAKCRGLVDEADLQAESPFFLLPWELRQSIYDLVRRSSVHVQWKNKRLAYTACVTDHDAPDSRQTPPLSLADKDPETICRLAPTVAPDWAGRLASSWGNHWKCEELSHSGQMLAPSLALSLACKRL
jgi:hypothetical protein